MIGQENGWYYDCYGKRTYPVDEKLSLDDGDRLEFLLRGWRVNSTCADDEFFVYPLTGYFPTPRQAVDCAIDIMRQRGWRCCEEGCLEKAIHLITCFDRSNASFKKCSVHVKAYQTPETRDLWNIEELSS